jgi:hypothetical protein
MSGPGNDIPSGDSTPTFDFLREHDDGSRTRWPTDPDHDSAIDMLPPEDEAVESQPESIADEGDINSDSGSSIHKPVTVPGTVEPAPDAALPTESEPTESPPAVEEGEPNVDDSALEQVVETVSDVASAIEGVQPGETAVLEARQPTIPHVPPAKHNLLLVAVASYASAVTLALLYLLFQRATAEPSKLENLRDVKPLEEGEVQLVPVDADMPPGHTLALGQSQRFGNIVIEPLRVVREPLVFVHYSGREDMTRSDSEPVVKLWVRFTNVSQDQAIAPLDGQLLFTRVFTPETGKTRANQFVCSQATKRAGGDPVFVYDYSPTDEFDMAGQQLGRVLQPGESYETYIPTTEDALDGLEGNLIWRVHFRKGYSPHGFGVTTVVEVKFDRQSIESNTAAS